jgi:hypothetical protein
MTVIPKAIFKPQFPGILPDGIGLFGSFIVSTCLSHQSLAAWLIPQTTGPATITPSISKSKFSVTETPEEITPQAKAHIGGNHVIGLRSSRTTKKFGYAEDCLLFVTLICHILLTILNHATENKSFCITLSKLLKVDQ